MKTIEYANEIVFFFCFFITFFLDLFEFKRSYFFSIFNCDFLGIYIKIKVSGKDFLLLKKTVDECELFN